MTAGQKLLVMLGPVPCPQFIADGLAQHYRERVLVMELYMLGGREMAFLGLWVARLVAMSSRATPGPNVSVEAGLRAFRAVLLAGPGRST